VDIEEIRGKGVGWIDLPQDMYMWWALVNRVIDLRAPYDVTNFD
jgi:hypothetical protein